MEKPTVTEAIFEIEGLANEEISRLLKQGDRFLAELLHNSITLIKDELKRKVK